jgi:Cu-Zn family superoxide dismutase
MFLSEEEFMRTGWQLLLVTMVFASFGYAQGKPASKTVELKDGNGESIGTATIRPAKQGVTVKLNVKRLPTGEHALHFHQASKCEGPDFKSAGGHFNPESKKHGLQNPEGPHAGDMLNFTVKADGTSTASVKDERVTLNAAGANSLFANGGTALVIHAKPDDYKSDPAGNAGDRIACGVITK